MSSSSSSSFSSRLLTCPYEACHQIKPERMAIHLVKCAKSYPKVVLVTCVFNATHRIPRAEEADHVAKCPDRRDFEVQRLGSLTDPKPSSVASGK